MDSFKNMKIKGDSHVVNPPSATQIEEFEKKLSNLSIDDHGSSQPPFDSF